MHLSALFCVFLFAASFVDASLGDRLPEFRECVSVSEALMCTTTKLTVYQTCTDENCQKGDSVLRKHCNHMPPLGDSCSSSAPSPPVPLDLPYQLRLCLPAYRDGSPTCKRPSNAKPHCSVPRQMAVLSFVGHAGTGLGALLFLQPPGSPRRDIQSSKQNTSRLSNAGILPLVRLCGLGELDIQHDFPH